MEQERNLWVIPTDEPSRLWKNNLLQGKLELSEEVLPYNTSQNIYITSDEEIKEGDWFITEKNTICKCVKVDEKYAYSIEAGSMIKKNCKKIILTTDPDLIKDGVQAIDDDFLEWFVNNPDCEEVLVIKNWNYPLDKRWEYKINFIIIKEYDPNQNALNFEIDALKRQVEVLKHQQEQFTQEGFNNTTNQAKEMETEKTNDELIGSIIVNESNFNYIAKTGKINGSLLIDIRRILDEKVQPVKERKCYIQQKLDEANELLYKNGIKERPYTIDHRGA